MTTTFDMKSTSKIPDNNVIPQELVNLTAEQEQALLKKPLEECSEPEVKARLRIREAQLSQFTSQFQQSQLEDITDDDDVWVEIPALPTGELFKINEQAYYGRMQVKYRTARTLLSLVSEAYRVEREKDMRRGNLDGGGSALLRGEHLARIERYKTIMGEGA
jgi:hypothetical protein